MLRVAYMVGNLLGYSYFMAEIQKLAEQREQYRKQKNWAKGDTLRQQIQQKGWAIEDTESGPKIKKLH